MFQHRKSFFFAYYYHFSSKKGEGTYALISMKRWIRIMNGKLYKWATLFFPDETNWLCILLLTLLSFLLWSRKYLTFMLPLFNRILSTVHTSQVESIQNTFILNLFGSKQSIKKSTLKVIKNLFRNSLMIWIKTKSKSQIILFKSIQAQILNTET